ncbi:lipase [Miniimonas arenae]|uniref:Lipase n=1 Tax=Miniimonas arenae TaxID=676201 RepID=A0A5C5BEU2_9MICO|nr:SGNH/GDSL hydrolase family protein [Miniimonas arenae]TNU76416.1 lipase [Miniimonas arenae]
MRIPFPDARLDVRGAAWLEPTDAGLLPQRLPAWTRAQYPDPLYAVNVAHPSGVRVRFRTTSDACVLHARVSRTLVRPVPPAVETPPRPPGPIDVVLDGELHCAIEPIGTGLVTLDLAAITQHEDLGAPEALAVDLPPGDGRPRTVELWLPYRDRVRLVALEADDVAAPPAVDQPRWVHHGSSISHGAEAASPTGTWPAVAARTAGLDLVNLGLSGAAMLDPFVARTMRDAPADLLSLKIGINVLNANAYGRRMFAPLLHGFLDTVREGHPDTPFLVISPLFCPIAEDTPGPTVIDPTVTDHVEFVSLGKPEQVAEGRLTLRDMRVLVADVVAARRAAGDTALHHLDGLALYGEQDGVELPMADLLHPDPPAQRRIGERAAEHLSRLAQPPAQPAQTTQTR